MAQYLLAVDDADQRPAAEFMSGPRPQTLTLTQ